MYQNEVLSSCWHLIVDYEDIFLSKVDDEMLSVKHQ